MKKFVSVLLLLSMLLTLAVSCKGNDGKDNTSETTEVTTEEPAPVYELPLVVDGKAQFKIVYPKSTPNNSDLMTAIDALRTKLKTVTGANFLKDTDDLILGKQPDASKQEILIGDTTRTESTLAKERLPGILDYGVLAQGSKLCVVANDSKNLIQAIYSLINRIIGKFSFEEGETVNLTLTSANDFIYHYPYAYANAKLFGHSISEFQIVYPKNCTITELRMATRMQRMVARMTGIKLPLVADDQAATDYEIRVGKTSRTTTDNPDHFEYILNVSQTAFEFVGGSIYAYEYAFEKLSVDFFTQMKTVNANSGIYKRTDVTSDIKADKNDAILGLAANYRVVYHNVWGWDNMQTRLPDQANQMLTQLYLELAPDIICMQEYTDFCMRQKGGTTVMEALAPYGYAEVEVQTGIDNKTATPILYNTERLELYSSTSKGVYNLTTQDKFVTWAVFKTKEQTPKVFAVVSMHIDYRTDEGRIADLNTFLNNVLPTIENYHCPIMIGGDLNCSASSSPFAVLTNAGFTDTHDVVAKNDGQGGSFADYPSYDDMFNLLVRPDKLSGVPYGSSIDHILYKGNGFQFKYYDVLGDTYTGAISDHPATVLDFNLQ